MNPIDFPEANLTLTRPADMTDEECSPLRVLRDAEGFTSCWMPSAEELASIAAGAPVVLKVLGRGHPPVLVAVQEQKGVLRCRCGAVAFTVYGVTRALALRPTEMAVRMHTAAECRPATREEVASVTAAEAHRG